MPLRARARANRNTRHAHRAEVCVCYSAQVMGDGDYHPGPVVIICPFATCKKSHRVLNGVSAVSQLYSHWQEGHKDNKAARVLEARWRLALDNKDK